MMILKKDPEEESTEQKAEETKDVDMTPAAPEVLTPVNPEVASPEEVIPPMTGPTTPPAPTGQEAAASGQGTSPSTPVAAGTESPDAGMPAEESVPPREFCYLSVDDILIEEQIRSTIDKKSESFRALMASIKKKGVLQPVLVTRRDDQYLLIAGERRLRACQQMNIPTIPARILAGVTTGEDRIGDQLIENLQREDIDPIDLGNAYIEYFKARHGELTFEQILNTVITYGVLPGRLEKEIAVTVTAILDISGKSIASIRNTLLLLKLPKEIRDAVKTGQIGVSQGYIFAANVDHPSLMKIFSEVVAKPVTNEGLKIRFVMAEKTGKAAVRKVRPIRTLRTNMKTVRAMIEDKIAKIEVSEMSDLLADLQALALFIQQELAGTVNGTDKTTAAKAAASNENPVK
jgi:hypothetical protein